MSSGSLQITLPSDSEIRMTRVFDAPRRLVWEAWTRPDLLKRWLLGPPGWTMVVCEVAARAGDSYRYVWRKAGGIEMGMGGVMLEFVPPERMVSTEQFDDPWYEGQAIGTIVFTETEGKTTLTQTIRYGSKAVRDAVLKSPMESGVAAGYDRLDELLATLA